MSKLFSRRPSASLIISVVALVFAVSGTAVAATKLTSGDKLIAKSSLSGNRLKNKTLTGTQINLKKLGTVPSAATAATATNATNASVATIASNAAQLQGQPASAFLPVTSRIGSNGIVTESGSSSGNTTTVFTDGPFSIQMVCTKDSSGNVTEVLNGFSSTGGANITGNPNTNAGTAVELANTDFGDGGTTTPETFGDFTPDFELSGGPEAIVDVSYGINSLATDCWANAVGIS